MTKSEIFKAAHAATKLAIAEQVETKHPSAHKSYAKLFGLALSGYYAVKKAEAFPVKQIQWATVGGTND
jgi:hypothetical protein